jgi:hypothetical protein
MKEFYIDFETCAVIKADSEAQAMSKFWKCIEELQNKDVLGEVEFYGIEGGREKKIPD